MGIIPTTRAANTNALWPATNLHDRQAFIPFSLPQTGLLLQGRTWASQTPSK